MIDMNNPNIINYADYRNFLTDAYLQKKTLEKRYSYKKFSKELGFSHSNFLLLVIKSMRNLSLAGIQKVSKGLRFGPQEQRYFKSLVLYNQAEDEVEKKQFEKKLKGILGGHRSLLTDEQMAYFSKWYLPVIREIVSLKGFVSNLNWISKKLRPHVEEGLVKEALSALENLGFIKRIKDRWIQTQEHLTTKTEVSSATIISYHQQLIRLGLGSLAHPANERDISSMTLSVSRQEFEWLKKRLTDFRYEVQEELSRFKDEPEMVCQINIQLFKTTE
ncbi:MAG: TIGR02147 family protein [Deltaproteobacteria bacterium]|nr:TIGR02147 family protein [Deltaproteobacteria bacterium]